MLAVRRSDASEPFHRALNFYHWPQWRDTAGEIRKVFSERLKNWVGKRYVRCDLKISATSTLLLLARNGFCEDTEAKWSGKRACEAETEPSKKQTYDFCCISFASSLKWGLPSLPILKDKPPLSLRYWVASPGLGTYFKREQTKKAKQKTEALIQVTGHTACQGES